MQRSYTARYFWLILFALPVNSFYCKAQDSLLAQGFFNSGMMSLKRSHFTEAILDFTEVIKYGKKEDDDPYYFRGYAEMMSEQYQDAVLDFDTALQIEPGDGSTLYERGLAFSRWGKYRQAIADFNRFEQVSPNNTFGYEGLGFAYLKEEKFDSALYFLDKGMSSDSSNIENYFYRGFANYKLKNYSRALPDLKIFLKGNPNHIETLECIMNIEYYLNNDSNSIYYADRYLVMKPDDAKAYYLRGQAYFRLKGYIEAADNFSEVIKRKANLSEAYYSRGICYVMANLAGNACADLKKAALLGNKNAETLVKNYCK